MCIKCVCFHVVATTSRQEVFKVSREDGRSIQKKVKNFAVGEVVSVRILRIDRTSSDLPRLPRIVVQLKGEAKHLHRLRCINFCKIRGPLG